MQLIAETAFHHQGDLDFQKNLIDKLIIQSAADILKVHLTLDIDEYMLADHPLYSKLQNWIFSKSEWEDVLNRILKSNKQLMTLVNDTKAVELAFNYDPKLVEVHAVCLNDTKLLDALSQNIHNDTKVVIGVGGSTLYEIEKAINKLENASLVLMFGFQNFPTDYSNVNIRRIQKIMRLFPDLEYGYADHTSWDEENNLLVTLFGAAQGMKYVEKHVTTELGTKRTDYEAAISIDMLNELKEKMLVLEKCMGDGKLELNKGEKAYSKYGPMKKAPVLNTSVKKNETLTSEIVSFKRTGQVSAISQIEIVDLYGQTFCNEVEAQTAIQRNMLNID